MSLVKKAVAEFIGTFWLVFGGCGSAILACGAENHGIHYVGVALSFGLTVLTMAYAVGHISGGHFNPAVTLGLLSSGRFKGGKETAVYIISQLIGGILAAGILFCIAVPGTFATNGWTEAAPGVTVNNFGGHVFGPLAAFMTEAVLTFIFLFVIIGATDKRAPAGFAPIAIGLCLTLIHLISIPVTNTSVNPARSTAVAIFVGIGSTPMDQLWLFWLAPIVGAVAAGLLYRFMLEAKEEEKCCCGCKCECKKAEVKEEKKDEKVED